MIRDDRSPEEDGGRLGERLPETIVRPGDKCEICRQHKAVTRCFYCKRQLCDSCIRWDESWGKRRPTCGNCIIP